MIGDRIADRYRFTDRSATGGMGSVYICVDERLDRDVALKILKHDLSRDPRFVERFRREARSAAALSHPNIAKVYDYGTENGTHYIVMELAPGRDLARLLREEGRLDPSPAAHIGEQIASALGHAHARGIVHRDVKPANVIVDDDHSVKVTDFGIARAAGDATLTASGVIMGTVHYISPEQAVGTPALPASDVYSLGIVLYEMLTGTVPFRSDSPVAIAMAHADGPVPRPRATEPSVPPPLDDIVARATARSPAERFADGDALGSALAAWRGRTDPAVAPTVTLPAPEAITTAILHRGPVIPLARAARIGGAVLAALALVALLLAFYRAAQNEGPRARQGAPAPARQDDVPPEASPSPPASPSPTAEASPSPSPQGFLIPEEIIGGNVKEWEKRLKKAGFTVEKEQIHSDDAPKDAIVSVSPAPGSFLAPGSTVTLTYSSGKEPKEEEDD